MSAPDARQRAIAAAAAVLHNEYCSDTCKRWNQQAPGGHDAQKHIRYYEDRAREVLAAAEPHLDAYGMRIRKAFRQLAEAHRPDGEVTPFCLECGFSWPCRTRRLVAEVEEPGTGHCEPGCAGCQPTAEVVAAETERCAQLAEKVDAHTWHDDDGSGIAVKVPFADLLRAQP